MDDEIRNAVKVIKALVAQPNRADAKSIMAANQALRTIVDAILRLPDPPAENAKNRPF
jgi:hypothetical protein